MKNTTQKINLFLLILLLFIAYQTTNAQKGFNADSLYQIFQAAPDIEAKEAFLIENKPPDNNFIRTHLTSYRDWYNELYKESGYLGHEVNSFFYEGLNLIVIGSYPECIEKFEAALDAYEKIPNNDRNKKLLPPKYKIKYELSAAYDYVDKDLEFIIKILKEGLDEAKEANDIFFQARLNSNLGQINHRLGRTDLVFPYLLEADRLYESLPINATFFERLFGNKQTIAITYNQQKNVTKAKLQFEQLHDIYKDEEKQVLLSSTTRFIFLLSYGIFLRDENEYDASLPFLQEALEIARSKNTNNKFLLGYGLYDLALLYVYQKKLDKAKPLIEEFEVFELVQKSSELQSLTYEIRSVYEKGIGNYDRARKSQLKVKEFYEKQGVKNRIAQSFKELSEIEKLAGNYALAYEYLEKTYEITDSIYNEKIIMNQEKLQVQYETNKKENQIIALENQELESQASIVRQRNIIGGSLFGLLFLGILGFVSFRNSRKTKKINNLLEVKNQQNEVLLKEIHHRVKNNLQTISSLLSLQSKSINDPTALDAVQESRNRVASMALIHQKLYQGENLAAIEMRDYFKTIGRAVLKSFGDKAKGVELEVNMPEIELDVDTAIPIGLITNELITNSLKYAFQEKESGKIYISMTKEKDNLIQLQIADDGINQSTGISEGGTGFGTMLIKLLTTQLKGEIEQSTEQGTSTIIQFPIAVKAA